MLRQLLQALRFAIADFFAVPWPAVAALLVSVVLLSAFVYIRTVYSVRSHEKWQMLLAVGIFFALAVCQNYLKKR